MKRNFNIILLTLSVVLSSGISYAGNFIPLSLEKIFMEYQFYPATVDGIRSMVDGEHYTVLENGRSIVSYDYATGKIRNVLYSADEVNDPEISYIEDYVFSADENKILLTTEKSSRYRYSFEAQYFVYDRLKKKTVGVAEKGKVRLAAFSPDGKKIAYVSNNNLCCKDLVDNTTTRITSDGLVNRIINAAPDWVYEEEFSLTQAYCWSPDSRHIAFYRFDETEVPEFDMTLFNDLYPQTYRFKYPKAGEKNSVVEVRVFDIVNGHTASMEIGPEKDQYIPRIKWTGYSDTVCIIRLNRLQNKVDVLLANARNGSSRVLFSEENARFISEINDDYIHFTPDGRTFIIRSERTGYFQYDRYSISGAFLNPVTQGDWDTDAILGIDDEGHTLYFSSAEESPLQRSVYSVKFDGTHKSKLSVQPGTNSAAFSSTFKYYINTWSDANTPPRITLHKINGSVLRVLEANEILQNNLRIFGFTQKKLITIPVKDNPDLNAYLVLPPDFDSTRVYPLFIKVYGGPEEQDVTDGWDNDLAWQQYLAQHGIVVACIDNRGTNGRGEAFRKSTYMELGKLESEDQINAARYLGGKRWIDKTRIGIWGWSYGGYMTLLCLTRGAEIYKMGIAVAPVTNWRFYDSIYTERFMRTPRENPDGYDLNSPIHFTGNLKGKLLLVHGTGDDNVHFQNSVEFTEKLIADNKQFEEFFYPNKNHNISGGNTRFHLFTMLSRFVFENL
jgi:dipeptidyl-peptidase 4